MDRTIARRTLLIGVVFGLVAGVLMMGNQAGAAAAAGLLVRADILAIQPESRDDELEPESDDLPQAVRPVADLRKLTSEEIQRIRFLELRAFRLTTDRPDRVTVKIPRQTVDDFLLDMEGEEGWRGDDARREFRKLTPPQKLHIMAKERREKYIGRLEIQSDPDIFVEFRKQVMPMVLRGCATTGCHSPSYPDDVRFGLFKDPKKAPATTYANFIMLNDLDVDGMQLINRVQPDRSLLLTYMLPEKEVKPELRHPGGVSYRPIFQTRTAPAYKKIERWIATLRQPPPDYGVSFVDRAPTSIPAEDDEP